MSLGTSVKRHRGVPCLPWVQYFLWGRRRGFISIHISQTPNGLQALQKESSFLWLVSSSLYSSVAQCQKRLLLVCALNNEEQGWISSWEQKTENRLFTLQNIRFWHILPWQFFPHPECCGSGLLKRPPVGNKPVLHYRQAYYHRMRSATG